MAEFFTCTVNLKVCNIHVSISILHYKLKSFCCVACTGNLGNFTCGLGCRVGITAVAIGTFWSVWSLSLLLSLFGGLIMIISMPINLHYIRVWNSYDFPYNKAFTPYIFSRIKSCPTGISFLWVKVTNIIMIIT